MHAIQGKEELGGAPIAGGRPIAVIDSWTPAMPDAGGINMFRSVVYGPRTGTVCGPRTRPLLAKLHTKALWTNLSSFSLPITSAPNLGVWSGVGQIQHPSRPCMEEYMISPEAFMQHFLWSTYHPRVDSGEHEEDLVA